MGKLLFSNRPSSFVFLRVLVVKSFRFLVDTPAFRIAYLYIALHNYSYDEIGQTAIDC